MIDTFFGRLTIATAALALETLIVSRGDLKWTAITILAGAIVLALKAQSSVNLFDLLDRSTVYFGLIPGVAIGFQAAKQIDQTGAWQTALGQAILSVPGLLVILVFGASFWVRAELIRQSLRKGFGLR